MPAEVGPVQMAGQLNDGPLNVRPGSQMLGMALNLVLRCPSISQTRFFVGTVDPEHRVEADRGVAQGRYFAPVSPPLLLAPLCGHVLFLLSAVAAPTLHDHLDPSDTSKAVREVLV